MRWNGPLDAFKRHTHAEGQQRALLVWRAARMGVAGHEHSLDHGGGMLTVELSCLAGTQMQRLDMHPAQVAIAEPHEGPVVLVAQYLDRLTEQRLADTLGGVARLAAYIRDGAAVKRPAVIRPADQRGQLVAPVNAWRVGAQRLHKSIGCLTVKHSTFDMYHIRLWLDMNIAQAGTRIGEVLAAGLFNEIL